MLHRAALAAVAVASALALAMGPALAGEEFPAAGVTPGAPASAAAQATGKAIFEGKGNCAICHGRDAKGMPLGPDLTDGQWLQISGALAEIDSVIRNGVVKPKQYPAPMPPMGGAEHRGAAGLPHRGLSAGSGWPCCAQ
jgi:mono/diheme cytochrome c family protein